MKACKWAAGVILAAVLAVLLIWVLPHFGLSTSLTGEAVPALTVVTRVLYPGENFFLQLTGTEEEPHWIIDDPHVASLRKTQNGVIITGKKKGHTKVTVTAGEANGSCSVQVMKKQKVTFAGEKLKIPKDWRWENRETEEGLEFITAPSLLETMIDPLASQIRITVMELQEPMEREDLEVLAEEEYSAEQMQAFMVDRLGTNAEVSVTDRKNKKTDSGCRIQLTYRISDGERTQTMTQTLDIFMKEENLWICQADAYGEVPGVTDILDMMIRR